MATPGSPARDRPARRLSWRALAIALVAVLLITVVAGFWLRSRLTASLPQLDGTHRLAGLSAPVSVTRDAQGIPTIRGQSRHDVARATGFLHAQERFFQMDLARRRAAGELSALVGGRALPLDREIRIHRFRAEARQAVDLIDVSERAALEAYSDGVNAGLEALAGPPFEYLMLRQQPEPWKPEDTFLVVLSMFVTLQESDGAYESTLATMQEVLPKEMFDLLAPRGTEWDAPIEGPAYAVPPVPGPDVYDLRSRRKGKPETKLPPRERESVLRDIPLPTLLAAGGGTTGESGSAIGSNSWVVSGAHTTDGHPLLANDMHLAVRVPNTWYRAVLEWKREDGDERRLVGVTLPGTPALVVGSNEHVAWGFTNSYADWSDIVLLEVDPTDKNRYRTPDGWRTFERHEEIIRVAGEPDERFVVPWTVWGPVMEPDRLGRPRAYKWVAHAADRLARTLAPFEQADSVLDAFEAANGLGAPGQNLVVADRDGRIGWSVYGAIPRRIGFDGRLPSSWSDGARGWQGWLDGNEYPRVIDPASGRIWTANARVVDGERLAKLGDGNYEVGSRATIIRNRLMAKDRVGAKDLLEIQMNTSSEFLARWRGPILRAITPATVTGHPVRALFREIVEKSWTDDVTPDAVAYRLTRAFREAVVERVVRFVLVECYEADPTFDYYNIRRREGPVWKLITEQPQHLLDPRYATWNDLLLSAVDTVIEGAAGADLRTLTWGNFNATAYRHPLSGSLPLIGRWLDMPPRTLPGDLFTPNMHWGSAAPSERLIVSPGRENEAVLHMPTGQSGHPLSPFYASSHDAWVNGVPTPLMPGPAQHQLMLVP